MKNLNPAKFKAWLDANRDKKGTEEYRIVEEAYRRLVSQQPEVPQQPTIPDPQQFLDWMNANQDKKGTKEYQTVEQAYIQAYKAKEAAQPEGYDFSFVEMAKNVPRSAIAFGSDIASAVTHPKETAKALGNLLLGIGQKLVPGEQPEEVYADAAWRFIADRYGSIDAFKKTLEQDPVGTLADLSAVASLGGAALRRLPSVAGKAGAALTKAGVAMDPTVMAANVLKSPFMAAKKAHIPRRMYEGAAKFTKSAMKEARKGREPLVATKHRIAEMAMDEGVLPTYKGIYKLQDALTELDVQIGDLISKYEGRLVPTSVVFKKLGKYANDLRYSAMAPEELQAFHRVVKNVKEYLKNRYGKYIPVEDLQKFKTSTYKRIDWTAIRGEETAKNAALKAMASGAQEGVSKTIPEIDALNKEYGKLRMLQDALNPSAERIANRSVWGARTLSGGVIGGATGGTPGSAALGAMAAGALSPEMMARAAIAMHKLGNVWLPDSTLSILLRQAAYQTGNLNQLGMLQPGQ